MSKNTNTISQTPGTSESAGPRTATLLPMINLGNKKQSVATTEIKRDFFKLFVNPAVQDAQSDTVIKKIYGEILNNKKFGHDRKKSVDVNAKKKIEEKRLNFSDSKTMQDFAIIYNDESKMYEAKQVIFDPEADTIKRNQVNKMVRETMEDFEDATTVTGNEHQSKTLFGRVLQTQETQVSIHKVPQAAKRDLSPTLVQKKRLLMRRRESQFVKAGKVVSTRLLIEDSQAKLDLLRQQQNTSEVYLPATKRKLKAKVEPTKQELERKAELELAKKVRFEEKQLAKSIKGNERLEKALKRKQTQDAEQAEIEKIRKKRPPPKRKLSFSEGMMKYDDAKHLMNPIRDAKGPSIKQARTILAMMKSKRFPVPEALLNVPDDWDFFIDSLHAVAYNSDSIEQYAEMEPDLFAPHNSIESLEEVDFASSSEGEQELIPKPQTRKEKKEVKEEIKKQERPKLKKDALALHGFDVDQLGGYPAIMSEGDVPNHLLIQSLEGNFENLDKICQKMDAIFKEGKLIPSLQHTQLIYEQYCQDFRTTPIQLKDYFKEKSGTLHIHNQAMPEQQLKAICCSIPLINKLTHVSFENNNITDFMGAAIFIACFMAPYVKCISIKNNFLRGTASNTFYELRRTNPNKIEEIRIPNSMHVSEHLDNVTRELYKMGNMHTLDFGGIPLSIQTAKNIGHYLVNSKKLRFLNVSGCKLAYQGTRYLVDGLNRNQGLQFFNFALNDMNSSIYEFAIKIAKVLTRHQHLMHIDLSGTGLKKEEVLFIGMAVSTAKSCISIHLSGNNLDYYERIFLRTLVNAKVSYHFRNMAAEQGAIRSQKERNQVMELNTHDFSNSELISFMQQWNYIDKQRIGLDEQINTIMKEIDLTKILRELKKGNKTSLERTEILTDLIERIQKRMDELALMEEEKEEERDKIIDLNAPGTLTNFKELGLYNMDKDGKVEEKKRDLKDGDDGDEDFWLVQNALKIDRIKNRIDGDAKRQKRAKSAGEMALLFMGINKIAYDLLLENPMTGYMNEIIFTRVLGNDDILNGNIWKDSSQCWICEKWDKTKICYHDNDRKLMQQNIEKLAELDQVIKECVVIQNEKLIKKVPESEIKAMYDEADQRDSEFGAKMLKEVEEEEEVPKGGGRPVDANDYVSVETPSDDKIYTESLNSTDYFEEDNELAVGDMINPIIVDKNRIMKQLPKLHKAKDLVRAQTPEEDAMEEESDIEKYKKTPPRGQRRVVSEVRASPSNLKAKSSHIIDEKQKLAKKESLIRDIVSPDLQSRHGDEDASNHERGDLKYNETIQEDRSESTFKGDETMQFGKNTVATNLKQTGATDLKKTKVETPTKEDTPEKKNVRVVQKQIFFQGTCFIVEEEISIDSADEESIATSEDSFEVDHKGVVAGYQHTDKERLENMDLKDKEKLKIMQGFLEKNVKQYVNIFGRKQIFLVASFNDWVPVEMNTQCEIKQIKAKGMRALQEMTAKALVKLGKSKKKDENIIHYTNFVVPGKHYFYFIYQNNYIFLSPNYDIVRFKGTNTFLNMVKVVDRTSALQQVTLRRNLYTAEAMKFNKDKSVWKTFIEDTPDHLMKCLEQDLAWGKISRVAKDDMAALKKAIFADYLTLKNIFTQLSAQSSYPVISWNDYSLFVTRSQLQDKRLIISEIDRALISTNFAIASQNPHKNSAEKELHRYEFIEIIVRLSIVKYLQPKLVANIVESYQTIVPEIIPRNPQVEGYGFREQYMYNLECDEIFRKNEPPIKAVMENFFTPAKKFLNVDDTKAIIKKADLNLNENKIIIYYAESLMTRIDTLSDLSVMQQMKYVEFLCFISRIAHELYKGTKQESIGLHFKIDAIMTPIFDAYNEHKLFSFKEGAEEGEEGEDDDDDEEEEEEEQDEDEDGDKKEKKEKKEKPIEADDAKTVATSVKGEDGASQQH